MIPLTASSRLAGAVAILSLVFGAGWFVNGWRLSGEIEKLKRENAEKIAKGWETAERVNRDAVKKYADDLAAVRGRPPVVVRVCPSVPGAADRAGEPAAGVADTGVGEDIGPTLTACLTELYRYRALSEVLK